MNNKKPKTLAEYLSLRSKMGKDKNARKDYVQQRYKRSLRVSMGLNVKTGEGELDFIEENKINIGKYSLRTRIKKNPWLIKGRPASEAIKWLHKEVLKDAKKYKYKKLAMEVGHLYTFEYKNPKFKNTKNLPWFDKFPLVLSLGSVPTNEGVRNVGFNLHLLPPKIRIVVLVKVFEIFKRYYRYNIFFNRKKPIPINYKMIAKTLAPYGVLFSYRMYIPRRQRVIIQFPLRDWYKAIFLPSRGYDGIRARKLIQEWRKYIRKLGFATSERIKWTNKI